MTYQHISGIVTYYEVAKSQKITCYNHGSMADRSDEKQQTDDRKDDNDHDDNNSNKSSEDDEDSSSCNQNISDRELTMEQELRTTTIFSLPMMRGTRLFSLKKRRGKKEKRERLRAIDSTPNHDSLTKV
jgi:hypothetical protein